MGLKKGNIDIGTVILDNVTISAENLAPEINTQASELEDQQTLLADLSAVINSKRGVAGSPTVIRPVEPSGSTNADLVDYNTNIVSENNDTIERLIGNANTIVTGKYNISKTTNAHGAQKLTITDAVGAENNDINTNLLIGEIIYNDYEFPMDYRENLVLAPNYSDFYENNSITALGGYKFYNDGGPTGVRCNALKTVGQRCFYGCSGLTIVTLPSVTNIYEYAFYNCTQLTRVDLGSNITQIGNYGFYGCSRLEKVIIRRTSGVPTISSSTFNSSGIASGNGFVYVPNELVESYRSANYWSNYANRIDGIEFTKLTIKGPNTVNIYNNNTVGGVFTVYYNDVLTQLYDSNQEGYTFTVVSGNATLSESGGLTLNSGLAVGDAIVLQATSTYDPSISITKTLTVVNIPASYSVDLNNGQWVNSGTTVNGHTVYKSDAGSYNIDNGTSTATITVTGYSEFFLYIRSYSESNYDYTEAFAIDTNASRNKGMYTTKGASSSTDYIECAYELDGGTHTIQIMYSKDSSGHDNDDRGYFYIAS